MKSHKRTQVKEFVQSIHPDAHCKLVQSTSRVRRYGVFKHKPQIEKSYKTGTYLLGRRFFPTKADAWKSAHNFIQEQMLERLTN